MCPFEKKEKEFFLDKQLFFQEQKNFDQGTTFVQLLYRKRKRFQNDPKKFFFCFTIQKKLNKSCFLDKFFLFLKKKLVV